MSDDLTFQLMREALAVAKEGLAHGELPIGAILVIGDEVIARAYAKDQLISKEEMLEVSSRLPGSSGDAVLLFLETGMRVMEGLGLTTKDITLGELHPKKQFITDAYKKAGYQLYGYITLKKQLSKDITRQVAAQGSAEYVPLKHRPSISDSYLRYIPITSFELAEILKRRFLDAKECDAELLFRDCSYVALRRAFDEVFSGKTVKKTVHDTRHTQITNTVSKMGGDIPISIATDVWGIRQTKTLERYTHIAEALVVDQQSSTTMKNIDELEIKAL